MRATLMLPYRWFSNIIRLREKRPMAFPAVFGVIAFVSVARAELELLTVSTAAFTASGVLNNFAFYLLSAYLFALLASRFTGKPLERVAGIVVIGVFLGVFPPILDTLIGGPDSGHYRYVFDGFQRFSWSLINPAHYSIGEAITLWLLVTMLPLYVLEVTRSWSRALIALPCSYLVVVFIAVGPSTTIWTGLPHASPFTRTTFTAALTVTQLLLAQAAYLALRKPVALRLLKRVPHAAPFVGLTLLGGAVSEYFAASGLTPVERVRFACFTAAMMLELCLIALVQNDAYDVEKDGPQAAPVSRDDAHFFTCIGVLIVLSLLIVMPGVAIPMALFLCVSTLYSYDFYRGQRFFPANYKSEGIWGWSAFVLGGSAGVSVAHTRTLSKGFLLASLLVFGGFSVFNVFKDYKDIRSDYRVRNQTLYVLALRRGVDLRTLHLGLRTGLLCSLVVPLVLLGRAGVGWLGLFVVTACAVVYFHRVLGGPPRKVTVLRFLSGTAAYVTALAVLLELQLAHPAAAVGEPPVAAAKAEAAVEPTRTQCASLALRDYGRFDAATASPVCVFAPASADELALFVREAHRQGTPLRPRGAAHSANRSTLPREGEVLVSTSRLDRVRFEQEGSVTAEAGVPVVALSARLHSYGLELPVVNDGWSGPTVGGYISAGGMGVGAAQHGGLWANVLSITLVDGTGALRVIDESDDDFPWVFGSMGQLGVIVSARLKVVPVTEGSAPRSYPSGEELRVGPDPTTAAPGLAVSIGPGVVNRLRWFTLFVAPNEEERAQEDLREIEAALGQRLKFRDLYRYPFADRGRIPPLVYGRKGPFLAVGIWAELTSESPDEALAELEDRIAALVATRGYRRYIQSETARGPDVYRTYFGSELYERFRAVKKRFDPKALFGRGSVFEPPRV